MIEVIPRLVCEIKTDCVGRLEAVLSWCLSLSIVSLTADTQRFLNRLWFQDQATGVNGLVAVHGTASSEGGSTTGCRNVMSYTLHEGQVQKKAF